MSVELVDVRTPCIEELNKINKEITGLKDNLERNSKILNSNMDGTTIGDDIKDKLKNIIKKSNLTIDEIQSYKNQIEG